MHEVRSTTLVRESNIQLLRYLFDTCTSFSMYLLIFKSQKRSSEALNFCVIFIDYTIDYTIGFIVDYTAITS